MGIIPEDRPLTPEETQLLRWLLSHGSRRRAQVVADLWEKAAKLGSERRLGEAQARRVLGEIYQAVNAEVLASATVKNYLKSWLERRKADVSPRTLSAYSQVSRDFLVALGDRGERDISQVSKADIARYRDTVLRRTSVATANKSLKYLRVAIGSAHKDGLMQDNPAAKLDTLKRQHGDQAERRPFTIPEMKSILSHADDEWRGIILCGLYTGQRLMDIASLTWQNVDLETETFHFVTGKTGRRMHLPIAAPRVDLRRAQ